MNRLIRVNAVRLLLFILVQILVLRHVSLGPYIHIFLYPIGILLLPIGLNTALFMLFAFLTGLSVDMFYHSLGVHAGAMVLMAFLRPFVLKLIEPHSGYEKGDAPVASKFGLIWYLEYSGILLFLFVFTFYSLEAFSFIYWLDVLIKTILSFIVSYILVLIHQMILNPRN